MKDGRRFVALAASILFFVWILPLGAFIRPCQEKVVCGGQRAICLCTHIQGQTGSAQGSSLQGMSAVGEEENTLRTAAGQYYFSPPTPLPELASASTWDAPAVPAYRNPFFESIEHVPKPPDTP